MKKIIFIIIINLWFIMQANSQINYTVSFNTSDLSINIVTASDSNTYSSVNITKLSAYGDIGKPSLPVKYVNLYIPNGQDVNSINFTTSSATIYNLTSKVSPIQLPVPTFRDPTIQSFTKPDSIIYNSTTAWPLQMVKLVNNGYFDGNNRIITLEINPFQYHPISNDLDFFTTFNISVNLKQSTNKPIDSVKNRSTYIEAMYSDILKNMVDNPQEIIPHTTDTTNQTRQVSCTLPTYEYVIITDASLVSGFTDFIEWKKRKGINIGIVTTNDIYNCSGLSTGDIIGTYPIVDNAGKVRQYLHDAHFYGNPSTTWVLIAGDSNTHVPIRIATIENSSEDTTSYINILDNNIPTDWYFTDLTGDWNKDNDLYYGEPKDDSTNRLFDIFVGRLICSDTTDIRNWSNHVLKYEQNPGNGDYSYLMKSFSIQADQMQQGCGGDFGIPPDQADSVAKYMPFNATVWGETPAPDAIFNTNGYALPGGTIMGHHKGAEIITELNTHHYAYISWFCHGCTNWKGSASSGIDVMTSGLDSILPCWSLYAEDSKQDPDGQPEIGNGLDNLLNDNYPSILYAVSCDITPFDKTSKTGNSGGMNCGEAFTKLPHTGGVAFLGNTRWGYTNDSYLMYQNFAQLISNLNDTISHLGVAENRSRSNNQVKYLRYSHNLIGCPETELWTAPPQNLNVTTTPSGFIFGCENTDTVTVTVSNFPLGKPVTICLYKNNEVFMSQTVTSDIMTYIASCTFTNVHPTSTGSLYVTVTAHNYIPYQGAIPIGDQPTTTYTVQGQGTDSTETWTENDHTIVNTNVDIPSGQTLNISGGIHQLTAKATIRVHPGGKLIVDGATLTNLCDNKIWKGIEVWGTSGKGQNSILNSPYQGMVQLINGAEIDNADIAITLWHTNDYSTTGGIVIANNANFFNNRISVEFMTYQNIIPGPTDTTKIGNLSQFVNCTFQIDDDYISNSSFFCHAHLLGVNGVFFQGCNFLNYQSNRQYGVGSNNGIFSMDAGYTVNGYCDHNVLYGESCPSERLTKCYFSGFNHAIRATTSASTNVVVVDESVFDQNVIGVEFDGVKNSWVNRSIFFIGDSNIASLPNTYPTGIFTYQSTGYRIEEDTLQLSSTPVSINYGIRINNSLDANNQVYKNATNNLTIGELAEGVNKNSTYNFKGLQILCNTHVADSNAINIASITGLSNEGIRYYQGDSSTLTSAGNLFTQNDSDIVNGTLSPIMYYYTDGLAQPQYFTPFLVDTIHVTNENKCPSNFNNGYSFPLSIQSAQTFANNYGVLESTYLNLLYNYSSMIDGGDENMMLNKIESTWSNDAWKMRAELLAKSPYLSQDVLAKVAQSDILPQAMLLEISLANPDATRDEKFIDFIGNKIPNPLPQYMLDLIVENWHAKTARTLLEANLADVSSQMSVITNILVTNCMLDTIQQKDVAIGWMLRRGDLSDYYSAAEYCIESNDYTSANNYRRQIPELFKLTDEQHAEYINFKEYLEFRNSIASDGRNIMQLTELEIETLQQIADNNTGRSSVLAQNILCFCYKRCIDYLPAENEGKHLSFSKPKIPANQIIQSAYNKITATPNPASVYVAFSWTLPLLKGNAELCITDINGKTIAQQTITAKRGQWIWDTRAIKNSIYLYDIKSDNQCLGNGKIVINK